MISYVPDQQLFANIFERCILLSSVWKITIGEFFSSDTSSFCLHFATGFRLGRPFLFGIEIRWQWSIVCISKLCVCVSICAHLIIDSAFDNEWLGLVDVVFGNARSHCWFISFELLFNFLGQQSLSGHIIKGHRELNSAKGRRP